MAGTGVIVSKLVWESGEPPRFAERLEPRAPEDSGWAIACGVEDEAYMANASNFVMIDLPTLLAVFPALKAIASAPVGAAFRLEGGQYRQSD